MPTEPLPYARDGRFDREFAETTAEFRCSSMTGGSGCGASARTRRSTTSSWPRLPSLGLRGVYRAEGPSAGRVTDMAGRLYADGPSWDWYLPGRGLVASSRLRTVTGRVEGYDPMAVPAGWRTTGAVSPTPPVDPATVAADPGALAGSTLPEALWRDHDGPLYRFSPDGPDRVFTEGLRPYGSTMLHLIDHVYNTTQGSVFASTTANPDYVRDSARANPAGAPALFQRYRWRYDIVAPGGIDVNATLGFASPFPDQEEVLFPGGVAGRHIRGAQPMLNGEPAGPFIPNPHFAPGASAATE
ncbi:hypothetical protein GTX14_35475 [Streptomyces sp. SID4944]|nr:hypothetical protein [Streptomyces sp. SID4944]